MKNGYCVSCLFGWKKKEEDLYKGKRNFQGIKVTVSFFFLILTFMALKSYFNNSKEKIFI